MGTGGQGSGKSKRPTTNSPRYTRGIVYDLRDGTVEFLQLADGRIYNATGRYFTDYGSLDDVVQYYSRISDDYTYRELSPGEMGERNGNQSVIRRVPARSAMDALYDLDSARSRSTNKFAGWVVDAATWYITTGRASQAWERAFRMADPDALLEYAVSGRSRTDSEYVKRITTFLKRNIGLDG